MTNEGEIYNRIYDLRIIKYTAMRHDFLKGLTQGQGGPIRPV